MLKAITLWEAIEKSPILLMLLSQYWKNLHYILYNSKTKIIKISCGKLYYAYN